MSAKPSSFRSGVIDSIPITLGYFPVGLSFGIAAVRAGFTALEATFMSAVIYAGASQFLALALVGAGAPILVSSLSILATNLRHVLYGPAVIDKAGQRASTRYAWGWAAGLSDGVFGAAIIALGKWKDYFSERWMFGLGVGPYLSWVLGTAAGALLGGAVSAWPVLDAALGFLMPALFLAMLYSMASRAQMLVIAIAVAVAIPAIVLFSPTMGILLGMLAGALTGLIRVRDGA